MPVPLKEGLDVCLQSPTPPWFSPSSLALHCAFSRSTATVRIFTFKKIPLDSHWTPEATEALAL